MTRLAAAVGIALSMALPASGAPGVLGRGPAYPRIGNCYGAGLGWSAWEKGAAYWSKLDLFIGGGYDLHYDWDSPRWPPVLKRIEANIARIRQANPTALFLPYVDVIEGPDSPGIPDGWWDRNAKGERWSGWPGMFRINMRLPAVLQHNLDRVREDVLGRGCFDGVFYDCWGPDEWLTPATAKLRSGRAIVMVNDWNLPRRGFDSLNGVLSEDEINRVIDGAVDFEDLLARYLRWCRESRKPAVTMLVCRPRSIPDDPWKWSRMSQAEKDAWIERSRRGDQQTMRFGLTTTLMGDGYFGYDAGTMARGAWWWYPEYDAPLGYPRAPAVRAADGTWRRRYDGGMAVVNGSRYDTVVRLPGRWRDVSTGRVGSSFTIPTLDGRILVPARGPITREPDAAPRVTPNRTGRVRQLELPGGETLLQGPGGAEARLSSSGEPRLLLWGGERVASGGFPVAVAASGRRFLIEGAARTGAGVAGGSAWAAFAGTLAESAQRVAYRLRCALGSDGRLTVTCEMEALSDLEIQFWRHPFAFPIGLFAGGTAEAAGRSVVLPLALGGAELLPAAGRLTLTTKGLRAAFETSVGASLVDHRKWGQDEYLLAAYPAGIAGHVAKGSRWTVAQSLLVTTPSSRACGASAAEQACRIERTGNP